MFNQLTKSLLAASLSLTGLLATTSLAAASAATVDPSIGYDISYPQCGKTLTYPAGFAIVGVNYGHPLSTNPCLAAELRWADSTAAGAPAFYMNTSSPGPSYTSGWPVSQLSPQICLGVNSPVCAYDYGWNAAKVSFANAVNAELADGSLTPSTAAAQARWWLDVETGNQWETIEPGYGPNAASDAIDQQSLQGSIAFLRSIGVTAIGIYSTPSQWRTITGGTNSSFPAVPVWVPGYATLSAAQSACTSASFTGGRVAMIQYPSNGLDGDYVCGLLSSPSAAAVTVVGSAAYTDQLAVSGNAGTVTYVQSSGSPALTVSPAGLVATSGALAAGSYTASGTTSDASGDRGTFIFTLSVGTIIQGAPTSAMVKSPGSATFTNQLVVTGNNGTATFVQTSGAPSLIVSPTGLVTTSGTLAAGTYTLAGTTSDPNGDTGTFNFSLAVGTITQNALVSGSVVAAASSTFSAQLGVSRNDGAVTYVQTSGAPKLIVSPAGLITTSGTLAAGTYTLAGTTSDAFGDKGTFVFALDVTSATTTPTLPAATTTPTVPTAMYVSGHAVAGRTVVLVIAGAGFYGRPRVTSHVGTSAVVTRDSGTLLAVKVAVKPRSRNGTFTFTLNFAKGQTSRVKYIQR